MTGRNLSSDSAELSRLRLRRPSACHLSRGRSGGAVCLASRRFLIKISRLESRTGGVYRVAVENEAQVIRGDPCDYRADECDKAENVSLFIFQRQN